MAFLKTDRSRNILIASLGDDDYADLAPHLTRVGLDEGETIVNVGEAFEYACFPEAAVVSVSSVLPDGSPVEAGVVGICGFIGWPLVLGVRESPHQVVVQVGGGSALRIPAETLLSVCEANRRIADLLHRWIHLFTVQLTGAVASNLADPVEKRLCRWLLMCHDRLDGDEVPLTHQFIGNLLGVRRATVTDALHLLEGQGVIRSRRSLIIIRDRARLEALAGNSYGFAEAVYRKLIGPFGKGDQGKPVA